MLDVKPCTFLDLARERWPDASDEALDTVLWMTPFSFVPLEKIIEALDAMKAKWGNQIVDVIIGEMAEIDAAFQRYKEQHEPT